MRVGRGYLAKNGMGISFRVGSALEGCVHLARDLLSTVTGEAMFFLTTTAESWDAGD